MAHRAIERAETAILRAEVRVVDIAINDVADDAFRMQFFADCIGFHANADQVIALEHLDCLLTCDHMVLCAKLRAGRCARSKNASSPLSSPVPNSKRI